MKNNVFPVAICNVHMQPKDKHMMRINDRIIPGREVLAVHATKLHIRLKLRVVAVKNGVVMTRIVKPK